MLLACGLLKKVGCLPLVKGLSTVLPAHKAGLVSQPQLQHAGAHANPSIIFGSQGDNQME
jgi:hypothetical protein